MNYSLSAETPDDVKIKRNAERDHRGLVRGLRRARRLRLHRADPFVALALAALLASCNAPPPEAPSAAATPLPRAQADSTAAADWPTYNRDLAGTRHSPLRQINASNVANLQAAWSYTMGRNETTGALSGGSEFTPIVVGGVLYLAAADRVVALRAESGAEIWRYVMDAGAPSRRSVAYWPGQENTPARLFFTSGRRLIALDAATGQRAPEFGNGGEIQMPVVYNSAPTRFENLLIIGSNSPPGSVRAFDARTGTEVWAFNSVPKPGELGHETWQSESWRDHPNLLHWPFSFTVDVDRGVLYASFESPGPDDYYGGNRPGDNLFGNSIVALDVRNGRRKWHFQTVHHDIWDYDLPAPPGLLDVTINGETVPILAQAAKTGYMYILNRATGDPVFGIEERAMPQSNVPGEQSSPTQPIPVKPPPLARVSYSPEDIVTAGDTNAEHAQFCRDLRDRSGGLRNEGPFTPYGYRPLDSEPRSTLVFPGSIGGANWGGTASDPGLGYVFVNTMDEGGLGWIESKPVDPAAAPIGGDALAQQVPYRRTSAVGGPAARFWANDAAPDSGGNELRGSELAWPCQKPPWGRLIAVDAAAGDIVWQTALGITEQLPEGKQRTGRLNMGGPITTSGGLVFIGASNDRRFRAFDSRTGVELWTAELQMSAHAVPITYQANNGKQYVAVVAAGAGAIDNPDPPDAQALVVYALP
jgi:quinoprotein glucose dehydrogenase